jgi:hypothetical protein
LLLECRKSTLWSWGSVTWCENWGGVCNQCTQNNWDSFLSGDYKVWVVYQVNIDSILLQIDLRREDLLEFHARQLNSANHQSMNEINQVFCDRVVSRGLWPQI